MDKIKNINVEECQYALEFIASADLFYVDTCDEDELCYSHGLMGEDDIYVEYIDKLQNLIDTVKEIQSVR